MFRPLLVLLFFVASVSATGQIRSYFIGFTDRVNSPYSVSQPLQYLSQRAIDRRIAQNIPVVPDDLPVNPSYINNITSLGAAVLNEVKWMNGVTVSCDSTVLSAISGLPFVRSSTPVKRAASGRRIRNKFEPDGLPVLETPMMSALSTIYNYGDATRQINQLHGDFLHAAGFTGEGMLITVIDAGFNSSDVVPALDSAFSSGRIVGTWDFVDRQSSVFEDDAHGTSVLSCMAALVGGSMVGTAPHAEYLLLRSEDANTEYLIEEYNWAVAAAYADSAGADVITSSLGYFYFDDGAMDHSYADMNGNSTPVSKAADIAASKGILVLNSAGNTGNSSWRYIIAPADADSILAVGAVDSAGWKAGFSAWGPSFDGRVKPDVAAMGASTCVSSYNGSIVRSNGTSFSCPVLAGAAACLWQAHPDKTNMEVLEAIKRSANYFQSPGDSLGYGVPDMQAAHLSLGGIDIGPSPVEGVREVYPNPVIDQLVIGYFSSTSRQIAIRMYDATGKSVLEKRADVLAGSINRIPVAVKSIVAPGICLLEVDAGEIVSRSKLIVSE